MARRRVVGESTAKTDEEEKAYDRSERSAIEDEDLNKADPDEATCQALKDADIPLGPDTGTRRRVAVFQEVQKSDIDFRPPYEPTGITAIDEIMKKAHAVGAPPYETPAAPETRAALGSVLVGKEVTVVWGKELFSPKQFHTFEVGPFTATTNVLLGETISMAAERTMRDLRVFAEAERDRKKASYLKLVETTNR